jgi:hypothetical protein
MGAKIEVVLLGFSMSRNFYALAATLGFLALVSCGMTFVPSTFQPGLPANGSLWKTLSMFLLLLGLVSMLIGSMSHLFEQVDRRSEERRRADRQRRKKNPGESHGPLK